ncbi:MAG: transglutaminase domain-containing protein [Chitinophagaceae bacterium]
MFLRLTMAFLLSICIRESGAQDKSNAKFGKLTPADFATNVYSIDSSANAVIIADIGSTKMVGNTKGTFSLEFKNYRRAHILSKNGYDIANVEIYLYTNGNAEEELDNLKAVTYNLENGKVVETKLDVKAAVFKDKVSKNLVIKKFTFPNIREGSIIEYEYKIQSDFVFNLQPWAFQGDYPRLWSEYIVSIPEFYYYVTLAQGYQLFHIKDRKDHTDNFTVTVNDGTYANERSTFTAGVTDFRWVLKEVPALKEESFTSTLANHVSRIEFQLAEVRHPFTPRNIMGTWQTTCQELLKDEDFGAQLDKDNGWLNDVMDEATGGTKDKLEAARRIFVYVRDHMTCTGYNRKYLEKPLRTVLKGRNGNEAEINLLLTAMLRKADLAADPVMLSTRSHGYAYALYPLMDRFNYVVTRLRLDGREYYLDASHPRLGFGRLGYECYNGHARVINAEATPLEFLADSLIEKKVTSVFMINDEHGHLTGSIQQSPGYFESYSLRGQIMDKGQDYVFENIKKSFNADIEIMEPAIDSVNRYDDPLAIRYKFNLKTDNEDIIYFNPMFGEAWKENPFKSAHRYYPVEMPYAFDETYLLRIDVPAGYVVDELPRQMVVKLNEDNDGMFEYRLSESGGVISLRSRLRINRAYFQPDEYDMLREFFNLVVKKHAEQIVFKKKS